MSDPNASQLPGYKRFSLASCEDAMARHFPYCPEDHKAQVLQRLIARDWTKKTRIVAALSIVVHNYIRHNLTDYEGLIRKGGLTRK